MSYVFEKEMKLALLKVEYVISSITNSIKVVDMWYGGKASKISYMSDENRLNLMDELERDYLNKTKELMSNEEAEWLEGKAEIAMGI
jgi:Fe-S cluster biosynthesis and repair protein YggX|tara:strand:+ start:483 stop:743 length:261 start_codon:yes stop_codon:yes gene_type:complete